MPFSHAPAAFGRRRFIFLVIASVLAGSRLPAAPVNVLTYHNDLARTGQNTNETILTPANVTSASFGKLFSYTVDGYVFAQPLYVSSLAIPGQGTHNVVLVATEHNSVYAFDADSNLGANGGALWHVNLGPSAATPNNDFGNRYGPYHDIDPEVGITSTPVIDLASGTIYLDSFTHDGAGLYHHRVHALWLTNGAERSFSPVVVAASVPGNGVDSSNGTNTFNAMQSLQRPALTLANGILYVCYSGYADTDPYHGWVIGFSATNLQQLAGYVFNTTPNATIAAFGANAAEGGIWMSGNGPSVDAANNLYFEVGNGSFNVTNAAGTEYGDSFVKLSSAGHLAVADFFTPFNQDQLAANDTDLGSGGPVLLPGGVGSAGHPNLLVGCGKEGKIYLLDRDNMGHYNSSSDVGVVQELPGAVGGTWSSPAYFNRYIYYQGSGDVLKAFYISGGLLSTSPTSQSGDNFGFPGATPSISANYTNNAIAWVIQSDQAESGGPAILRAYNAYNVAQTLYSTTNVPARDGLANAVKFSVPTIVNGKVYVGTQTALEVLGTGSFVAVPVISPNGGVFTNSVTVTLSEVTPGVTLYFTLDNSQPTTNSTVYTLPFTVTANTAVKVLGFKPGYVPSPVVSATFINSASLRFSPGFLKQEFYSGYLRTDIESPAFNAPPTFINYLDSFEVPLGQGQNYAERVSGYFIPPQTADYVFFICSDDDSDLFLSTDDTPANKQLIAQETQWSNPRIWLATGDGSNNAGDPSTKRSDLFAGTTWPGGNTISLTAGSRYYIEADHHQGTGGDDLSVTFKLATAADPANGDAPLLTGSLIATWAYTNTYITIMTQPQPIVAVANAIATLGVSATSGYLGGGSQSPAILYQWQKAAAGSAVFSDIPNANANTYTTPPLTLADNGARYRVVLTTAGFTINSDVAPVTVVRDTTPPVPVAIESINQARTIVIVAFSEPLNSASAQRTQNYRFSAGNVAPASAALDGTGTNVTLTLASPLPSGTSITLSITNVTDLAGNAVAPNTTITFSVQSVTYQADILFDQPIAYYRFEEPAGTAVATNSGSTGGNGAYYTGNEPSPGAGGTPSSAIGDPGPRPPTYAGFAANNHSATFDGATRWVDTRNQFLQNRSAFTLEYWVAPTARASFPTRVGIVGQNDAVEYGFIDPNDIQIWTPGGGSLTTAYSFSDGEWHHIATIADGTSLQTYYDGVLVGTGGSATANYGASGYNVHIGGGGVFDPQNNWFNGHIDEVAIFDHALPASRVAEHFSAGKNGGILLSNIAVAPNLLEFTSIILASGQVVLQWTGGGTLEQASVVTGPWSTASSQANPQAVPVTSGNLFFRLRR